MACLSEDTILEFLQGNAEAGEAVHAHIDTCPTCRELLSHLARSSLAVASPLDEEPTDPEALVDPSLPSHFLAGRFRIVEALGNGAMGKVFRATDLSLGVDVAIKLLNPEIEKHPTFLRQLHREILTSRRISHPNVRRVYDLGEADGRHFISMEFIDGETLTARLARGPLPLNEALRILDQICAALAAAHNEEVVHRDLKPANVMLDGNDQVKVMDLGLARDLSREATMVGAAVGTPSYWSPEQSRGELATPRSDLFALGVIMCDLLCGESRGHQSGELLGNVPAPLRRIVARCLAAKPEDRPESANAVREAIHDAMHPTRSRGIPYLVGAAAVAAGLVVATWVMTRPEEPSSPGRDAPAPAAATDASDAANMVKLAEAANAARSGDAANTANLAEAANPATTANPAEAANSAALSESPPPSEAGETPPSAEASKRVIEGRESTLAKRTGSKRRRPTKRERKVESPRKRSNTQGTSTKPALEPAPNPSAVAAKLKAGLVETNALRKKRGLLVSDLDGWQRLVREVEAARASASLVRGEPAIVSLQKLADRAIDEAFIQKKLARISALSRKKELPAAEADRLASVLAQVHAAFFAGDYQTANIHLNRMWGILHPDK